MRCVDRSGGGHELVKRQHLYGLDLVRFGSAFLVLLFHLSTFSAIAPTHDAAASERAFDWLGWIGVSGWVGVEVFFVISGFVIAASAEKSTARDFAIKRGIRVFPALWICSVIALGVSLAWGMPSGEALNAFVRSIILSPQGPYIDGVVWTLVIEAVFYVYVAGLILLGARLGRSLLNIGGLLLGAGSVVFIISYMTASALGLGIVDTLLRFPFKVALLWHGVFFALGMLIRKAAKEGLSPLELVASGVFTVFCVIEIVNNVLVGTGTFGSEAYRIAQAVGIWLAAMAAIVASIFRSEAIAKAVGAPWVKQAGLMTYPLYLNHFTFGMWLTPLLAGYIVNPALHLIAVMAIILLSAWLVLAGPEAWLQSAAKRYLLKGRAAAPRPVTSEAS